MSELSERVKALLHEGTKHYNWDPALRNPSSTIVEQIERGGGPDTAKLLVQLTQHFGGRLLRRCVRDALQDILKASLAGETTEELMQGIAATAATCGDVMGGELTDYLMGVLQLPVPIKPRLVDPILKELIADLGASRQQIARALALGRFPTQIFINRLERSDHAIERQLAAMCSAAKLASAFAGKRPRRDASLVMGGL